MSEANEAVTHKVQCFQNKRIYLYAIRYQDGMEDGRDEQVWQKIHMTAKGRWVEYKPPNAFRTASGQAKGFTLVKKPIPWVMTEEGRKYIDEDYYIVNPHKDEQRWVVPAIRFEDAYEVAELVDGKPPG